MQMGADEGSASNAAGSARDDNLHAAHLCPFPSSRQQSGRQPIWRTTSMHAIQVRQPGQASGVQGGMAEAGLGCAAPLLAVRLCPAGHGAMHARTWQTAAPPHPSLQVRSVPEDPVSESESDSEYPVKGPA